MGGCLWIACMCASIGRSMVFNRFGYKFDHEFGHNFGHNFGRIFEQARKGRQVLDPSDPPT